ncbi:MAG: hypothetical protein NTZ05_01530 [Chloroflexi bacterium]|nr:hypothetical protein [Chloroflexota bacterium]
MMRTIRMSAPRVLLAALALLLLWPFLPPEAQAADPPGGFSAAQLSDDRFGLVWVNGPGYNVADQRYRQASDAGARWTRWPIYWHHIETSQGRLDDGAYAEQDAVVARDRAADLQVNGVIVGTPDWAASGGNGSIQLVELGAASRMLDPQGRIQLQQEGVGAVTMPPRNLQEPVFLPDGKINPDNYWARFVYTTALRYKGKVAVWEIWNEPDLKDGAQRGVYWNGTDSDYLWMLKVAYFSIRAADPTARVSVSGLAYWTDKNFLPRLLDLILADPGARSNGFFFDMVNYHLYSNPNNVYTYPLAARQEMAKRGITRPVWVNESNIPLCDDKQVDSELFCPSPYRGTMADQAGYIWKAFALSLASGVEKLFVFQFYDDDVGPHDWYGIVRNDGSTRPAYGAYQLAAKYLSWATKADRDAFGRTDAVVLRGTPYGKVTMLWARGQRNDLAKVTAQSSSALLVDTAGVERRVTPDDGAYLIPLTGGDPDLGGGAPMMLIEPVNAGAVTRITALPGQVSGPSFPVSWSVIQGNASGVRFDVEVRQGAQGRWNRWLSNTMQTSAVFGPETGAAVWPGLTYSFRVRARLPNGDAEPLHQGDGDVTTTAR